MGEITQRSDFPNANIFPSHCDSVLVVEGIRYINLTFSLSRISQHFPDCWSPRNLTEVGGPWLLIGFVSHSLTYMFFTDSPWVFSTSRSNQHCHQCCGPIWCPMRWWRDQGPFRQDHFSNSQCAPNHVGILLKFRFWFRSEVGPEFLHFYLPDDGNHTLHRKRLVSVGEPESWHTPPHPGKSLMV